MLCDAAGAGAAAARPVRCRRTGAARWGVVGWLWGWDELSEGLRDEVSESLWDEVSGSLRDELSEGLWDELSGALRDDLSGDRQVLLESSRERPVRHPRGSRRDLGS